MAVAKKFYTLDEQNKVIIIDKTVTPTDLDFKMVAMYGQMGYTSHEKIIRKPNKAQLKDADILKALKGNEEALKEYKRIKEAKGENCGFFAARSYAVKVIDEMKKKK